MSDRFIDAAAEALQRGFADKSAASLVPFVADALREERNKAFEEAAKLVYQWKHGIGERRDLAQAIRSLKRNLP